VGFGPIKRKMCPDCGVVKIPARRSRCILCNSKMLKAFSGAVEPCTYCRKPIRFVRFKRAGRVVVMPVEAGERERHYCEEKDRGEKKV